MNADEVCEGMKGRCKERALLLDGPEPGALQHGKFHS